MQLLLVASIILAFRSEVSAQPPFGPPFSRFPFDYGPPGYRPTPPPPPVGYGPVPFDRQRPPMPTPAMDGSPFPGDRYMDQEERRSQPSMQGRRRSNPGSYDTVDPRGSRESFDMPDRRDIHQQYQDTSGTLDIRRMRPRDQMSDSHDVVDPRSRTRYPQDSGDRFDRQISRLSVQDPRDQYDTSRDQYPTNRLVRPNPTTRDRVPYDVRRSFREPVDRRRYQSPTRIDMSDPRRFRSQSYQQTDSDLREPRRDTFRYRQSQSDGRRPGGRGAFRFSPGRIVVDRQNLINRNENLRHQSDGRKPPQRQQRDERISRMSHRNRQRNERVSRMQSQRQQRGERIRRMPSQSQQMDERISRMSSQSQQMDERMSIMSSKVQQADERKSRISSQSQQRGARMSRISSQNQQRDQRMSRMLSQSQKRDEKMSRMPSQRQQRDERIFGLISKQSVATSAGQTIRYSPTVENNRPDTNRGSSRGNELNDRRPFRRFDDRKPTKSVRLARDPFMRNRLSRRQGRGPRPGKNHDGPRGNRSHVDRHLATDKSMTSSGKQPQNNHLNQVNAAVPSNRLKEDKPFDNTVMDLRPNALIRGKTDVKRKRGHKGNKIHMSKNPSQIQNKKLINAPETGRRNVQKHGGARKPNELIDNNINFPSAPKQVNQLPRVVRKSDIILMNNVPKQEATHSSRGSAGEIKVITKKAKPTVSLKEVKPKQSPETKKRKVSVPKPRVVEQKGLDILSKRIPQRIKPNKISPMLPPGDGSILVSKKRKSSSGSERIVDGKLSQLSDISPKSIETYVEKNEQIVPKVIERKPEIIYKPKVKQVPPPASITTVKQTPIPTIKPKIHKKKVIRNEELRNIEIEGPPETKPGRRQPPKSIIKGSPNFDVFVLNVNDPTIPQDVKNLVPKGTSPEIIRALSRVLSEATFQKDLKPVNKQPRAKIVVNTRPQTSRVQSGQPNHAVREEPTAKLVVTTRPPRQTTTTKPPIDMKELLSLIQENKVSEAMKLMSQSGMSGFMPPNNGQRRGVNSYSQQSQNTNNMYNRFNYNPNPFSSGLFGNDIFGGLMANKFFEGSLEGMF